MCYYGAEKGNSEVYDNDGVNKGQNTVEQSDDVSEKAGETLADLIRRIWAGDTQQLPGIPSNETQLAQEGFQSDEQFNAEMSGYRAFTTLRKDEVLFVDKTNEPVGKPQRFKNFIDTKRNFSGDYLYTPGVENETGILSDSPAKEWREYVRDRLQREHPSQEITDDMNVVHFFQDAYETGDAELQEKISNGEIVSRDQILHYRIETGFPEAGGYNRVEYLQEHIVFRSETEKIPGVPGAEKVAVPLVVQAELRRLLPGLIAQESGFREDVVNPQTHATGSGQFMPETWERYTGTDVVSTNYADQVAVLGPMISDVYDRILDKIGQTALETFRSLFTNEDDFLKHVITPAVISGFHTGPDRIAQAAREYAQSVQPNDMPAGKDVFLEIATYGLQSNKGLLEGFKKESREYVSKVYAVASVLEEKYIQPNNQTVQLAQN